MADTAFYETSAQVIPLLLLAAGVETQWLPNLRPLHGGETSRLKARLDAVVLPGAALLILAGELAALHTSLAWDPTALQQRLTLLALLLGCLGVFTPILNAVAQTTSKALEPYGESQLARRAGLAAIRMVQLTVVVLSVLVIIGVVP